MGPVSTAVHAHVEAQDAQECASVVRGRLHRVIPFAYSTARLSTVDRMLYGIPERVDEADGVRS